MPEDTDEPLIPSGANEKPPSGITPLEVPIYCLTKLTTAEKETYRSAITRSGDFDRVFPKFKLWTRDDKGNLHDMYRIWRETGGEESPCHFALFIDRTGVANSTMLAAQPCAYTMLFSPEASDWARENLTSYLNHVDPSGNSSHQVEQEGGQYEGYMEDLVDDILGKRGLTYGRVPAGALRSMWANLDIANMDFLELVEYEGRDLQDGGKVELLEDPEFDTHAVMAKLWAIDLEEKAKERAKANEVPSRL
ncbi:hypothetical protein LTR78_001319 [Recurvomyces mirabilis]|uniref:Uncharacterized protein n=1 Tax=Recurvomyces mirabilis TaxID=574656 RepID=A0AAE0WVE1_9PEZI|nr:hypothetical protein LTR78_001319 [Recurvomyces mirabilis]KAK5161296.1 hypothetical protein LTS14_001092 [Recurvomyces mirabilis]